jgi:hypothetical protein
MQCDSFNETIKGETAITQDQDKQFSKIVKSEPFYKPTNEQLANASALDKFEYELAQYPQADCFLTHVLSPGIYARQIFCPAHTLLTSVKHKTTHPFVLVKGKIDIISQTEKICYTAPYFGVTPSGTKRVIYSHEDSTFITFHANPRDIEDPIDIGYEIYEENTNELIDKDDPNVDLWRKMKSVIYNFKNKKIWTKKSNYSF